MSSEAESMVAHLPEPKRRVALELAENVLWMADKLTEARRVIASSSVVIPYDNGGGQKGVRKNPAFEGYNALLSQYTRAAAQLAAIIGDTEVGGDDALDALLSDGDAKSVRARRASL